MSLSPLQTSASGDSDDPGLHRIGRVLRWLRQHLRRRPSPRVQQVLLFLAAVVFIAGGYLSIEALSLNLSEINWWPIGGAVAIGVPLSVTASSLEYFLSGSIIDRDISPSEALRVTTMASAANLLPIPGAFMVRTQALHMLGTTYGKAAGATFALGMAWIGIPSIFASIVMIARREMLIGTGFLAAGLLTLGLALAWILKNRPESRSTSRLILLIVFAETLGVSALAFRLILILWGLNISADLGQSFVLSVSNSLASATGILPGGFGIRELIAALLSPVIGLTSAAGFAATAFNRVVGIVTLAPVSLALTRTMSGDRAVQQPTTSSYSRGSRPADRPSPGADQERSERSR